MESRIVAWQPECPALSANHNLLRPAWACTFGPGRGPQATLGSGAVCACRPVPGCGAARVTLPTADRGSIRELKNCNSGSSGRRQVGLVGGPPRGGVGPRPTESPTRIDRRPVTVSVCRTLHWTRTLGLTQLRMSVSRSESDGPGLRLGPHCDSSVLLFCWLARAHPSPQRFENALSELHSAELRRSSRGTRCLIGDSSHARAGTVSIEKHARNS